MNKKFDYKTRFRDIEREFEKLYNLDRNNTRHIEILMKAYRDLKTDLDCVKKENEELKKELAYWQEKEWQLKTE